jgi:hypothetical protein
MGEEAEVIKLFPYTETPDSNITDIYDNTKKQNTEAPKVYSSTIEEHHVKDFISTEELYPARDKLNPILSTAIQLLNEGLIHINESIKMLYEEDFISSDDALQKFQALLPELFCCRSLGDGFGAIINSIYHSLNNMKGTPLNKTQLTTIQKILKRIHSEPFIGFDEAVEEIMLLESENFEVESPHFKYFADLLNE